MSVTPTKALIDISKLENLADKIRAKTGTSDLMTVDEMATAVENIPSGGLPAEYEAVEYIESTGTQYIDIGYKASSTTIWECECAITNSTSQKRMGLTAGYFSNTNTRFCFGITNAGKFYFGIAGTNANLDITNDELKHKFKIDMNTKKGYIDDVEVAVGSGSYSNPNGNGYIFANHGATGVEDACSAKLYSMSIKTTSYEGTHRYIPCYRKSDKEIGLYDLIADIFLTNQGTGSFTCYPAPPTT